MNKINSFSVRSLSPIHFPLLSFSEIAKELNITPVLDKIQDYMRRWIQNVNRMPRNRLSRLIKNTPQKAEGTKEDR
jgi:hypothetical protein